MPIAERLRPDDEVVVIQDFALVTGFVDEPVSVPREEEYLITTSDAALVVDVVERNGRLVEEGRWVQSTITARVVNAAMERRTGNREVLRRSQLEGQRIDMLWIHGGEVTIGSVTVRARPSQLEIGRRYLVFLDEIDKKWFLGTRFEIQKDGTLLHLVEPDDNRRYARSPLDGLRLERVLRDLKRESARRQ